MGSPPVRRRGVEGGGGVGLHPLASRLTADRRLALRYRSVSTTTVWPEGRWVARTAVDALLRCCPPGPPVRTATTVTSRSSKLGGGGAGRSRWPATNQFLRLVPRRPEPGRPEPCRHGLGACQHRVPVQLPATASAAPGGPPTSSTTTERKVRGRSPATGSRRRDRTPAAAASASSRRASSATAQAHSSGPRPAESNSRIGSGGGFIVGPPCRGADPCSEGGRRRSGLGPGSSPGSGSGRPGRACRCRHPGPAGQGPSGQGPSGRVSSR